MLDLLKEVLSISAIANVASAGFQTSLFIEDCVPEICHAVFSSVGGAHALILKDMSADSKRCLGNHRCCIPSPCITVVTMPKVMCYVCFSHCQKMSGSTYLNNGTESHTHTSPHTQTDCSFVRIKQLMDRTEGRTEGRTDRQTDVFPS